MQSSKRLQQSLTAGILLTISTGFSGCAGMNQSVSQTLGINGGARVPAPSTGSFSTPSNYSGANTPSNPAGTTPTPMNGTSQFNPLSQPAGQLISGINNAQTQFMNATDQARESITHTADNLNARVSAASNRIDRINQGVVQASAIMQDAIQAPPNYNTPVGSGYDAKESDSTVIDSNATWRKPNY